MHQYLHTYYNILCLLYDYLSLTTELTLVIKIIQYIYAYRSRVALHNNYIHSYVIISYYSLSHTTPPSESHCYYVYRIGGLIQAPVMVRVWICLGELLSLTVELEPDRLVLSLRCKRFLLVSPDDTLIL